jgi:hypothetical protein
MPFNPTDCTRYHYYEQKVQYSRQKPDPKTCWLSIDPDGVDLYMRNYLFDSNGMLMVFNSYGEGPISTHTGARVFHFFPRGRVPHAEKLNSQELVDKTATPGLDFIIESHSGRWSQNQSQGEIIEANRIDRNNQGGVEFKELPILILDSGFQMGKDPRNENGTSTFIDPNGQKCELPNSELFRYSNGGSIDLKFVNDQTLVTFLKRKCPNLNLSMF